MWKNDGYYQRSRDCGQTFTATKDGLLDAIVIRTSNSSKAVFARAIGQPMFMQLFEVTGTPTINDNATPYGSEPAHGFGVGLRMHRCDDYSENITFVSLGVAQGALFPDVPPNYPDNDAGKLFYIRCDFIGEHEIQLKAGHRYAFNEDFSELIEETGEGANCTVAHTIGRGASKRAHVTITNGNRAALTGFVLRKTDDQTTWVRNNCRQSAASLTPHARLRRNEVVLTGVPADAVECYLSTLCGRVVATVTPTVSNGKETIPLGAMRTSGVLCVRIRSASGARVHVPVVAALGL